MKNLVRISSFLLLLITLYYCKKDESQNKDFDPKVSTASTVTINTSEIGGNGLTLISSRDNDSPLSKSSFNTVVSKEGEQLLIITDANKQLRALTLSTPSSSISEILPIDAFSTALTLVFISPGISTVDKSEATLTMNQIEGLSSFSPLKIYLSNNLKSHSINDLASTVLYDSLLTDCVEEYYQKYKITTKGDEKGMNESKNMFSLNQISNNNLEAKNYAFRFVNVVQRDINSSLTELNIKNVLPGMKGAIPLSWGSLFTLSTLDPSTGSIDYSPYSNSSLSEIWICGPGTKKMVTNPPQTILNTGQPYFETIVYYVVFPVVDLYAGVLKLQKLSTVEFKELISAINVGKTTYFSLTDNNPISIARNATNVALSALGLWATVTVASGVTASVAATATTIGTILGVSSILFSGSNLVAFGLHMIQVEPYMKFDIVPSNGIPVIPTLYSPQNGTTSLSIPVTLIWNSSINSKSYTLQICKSSDFSQLDFNQQGITIPGKTVSTLQNGIKYYWRVNSTNDNGVSDWSNVWNFTISSNVTLPIVSTTAITTYTSSSGTVGGNVSSDGNASVTERGIYYGTAANPETTGSKIQIGSGTGIFSVDLSGLNPSTLYYVKAYAINSKGIAFGLQETFTTSSTSGNGIIFNPNLTYGTVSDNDGNTYKTIQIGTQTWMAENLKTTKFNDGTNIANESSDLTWAGLSTGAYAWYNNVASNKATYGALYNWYAVNTGNLCPTGWHVPSDNEWKTLESYVGLVQVDVEGNRGTIEGGKLKETGSTHWLNPNTVATNESGFTALPSGTRNVSGTFTTLGEQNYSWSSSSYGLINAWGRVLSYNNGYIYRGDFYFNKVDGFSVRCIKNSLPPTNGLIAYYPFNGNANDASGNGNNGTVNGATLTSDRFGHANSAYSFSDYNYINMGNILGDVFATNNYSISLWYNQSSGNNGSVINKWQNCCPNTGNNAFWATTSSIVTNTSGIGSIPVGAVGNWTHWAFTMNSGTLKIYVNGVLVSTQSGHYSVASTMNLYISHPVLANSFKGSIDDIKIYNRVLTDVEMQTLYQEGGW